MKTRIAPTPSGFLHLGNLYSFLITASIARNTGAKLLLRIDDIDKPRVRKEYLDDIFDTLNFFNIEWNEGPRTVDEFEAKFSQHLRMPLYQQALAKLVQLDLVFACNCSRSQLMEAGSAGCIDNCRKKRLPLSAYGASWRLRTEPSKEIKVRVFEGVEIKTCLPDEMKEFIVRKKDGFPAYQLTSLVDDAHFQIDLVVRGQDLWSSTLAQLYLSQLLDYKFSDTLFHHHALIMHHGIKLSKSAGANSIFYLRKKGKSAEQIMSLLNTTDY